MKRVAILISGSGSNMVRLVEDMAEDHPARPLLVLSNRPDAKGLEKAARLGIPTDVVDHKLFGGNRAEFEDALSQSLANAAPDVICLAGFMRILTPKFVDRWSGRIINIHPSLLPKYPGLETHARALRNRDKEAGCTVHEVTTELDAGPILGQGKVAVFDDDTPETLAARVLKMEHRLYPAVLRRFAVGNREPVLLSLKHDAHINAGRA